MKTNTQHTPGPWTAQQVDGSTIFNWAITGGTDNFKSIASVCAWPENKLGQITQAEADANARLIAAAPALLEAAQIGLACCLAWGGRCEARGESILAAEAVRKAEFIRAAIAQAEGRGM